MRNNSFKTIKKINGCDKIPKYNHLSKNVDIRYVYWVRGRTGLVVIGVLDGNERDWFVGYSPGRGVWTGGDYHFPSRQAAIQHARDFYGELEKHWEEDNRPRRKVVIQGHDRNGWDTEEVGSMKDLRMYLQRPHHGEMNLYVDGQRHKVPRGIGARCEYEKEWDEIDEEVERRAEMESRSNNLKKGKNTRGKKMTVKREGKNHIPKNGKSPKKPTAEADSGKPRALKSAVKKR